MQRWPTADALRQAKVEDIVSVIQSLGLQNKRARHFIRLSQAYVEDPPQPNVLRKSNKPHYLGYIYIGALGSSPQGLPSHQHRRYQHYRRCRLQYPMTPVSHMPGMGPYALDSYRIFCVKSEYNEWKRVVPEDKELIRYLKWKWAIEEGKCWLPKVGVIGHVDLCYLETLTHELIATRPY
ncbi:putative 5-Methylcytosine G/T mismatch-specific DNA glycosylase [Serpula lacrymans var. lacrymans S7.9]|nr:putative 5-Methylcytosine G/T mismatch-specific DNA glycosylase [Serpula lacrymans var. lacrymans S7.9]EGO30107.1 putative 5-Methylcytosine G/T mismatch-specific DNA glycosylase [Serpula lacrymans var. lacrymans S7.9]